MIVKIGRDILHYCDVCGEETGGLPYFVVSMEYGGEDESERLGDRDALWGYMSQPKYFACDDCRCRYNELGLYSSPPLRKHYNFLTDFELKARARRVEVIEKLAKAKLLPEFSEEKDTRALRFTHWDGACAALRKELAESKSDFGIERLAQALTHAIQRREEFR